MGQQTSNVYDKISESPIGNILETTYRVVIETPIKKFKRIILTYSQEDLDRIYSIQPMKDFNHDYAILYKNIVTLVNKITNEKGLDLIYETVIQTIHDIDRNKELYIKK